MLHAAPAIALPGCKSASQRALMLAAVAAGPSVLRGVSDCQDSLDLRAALARLGVQFRAGAAAGAWEVHGQPPAELALAPDGADLFTGEGGSTLRFLMALLAAGGAQTRLRMAPALARRPHTELIELVQTLGARVATGEDAAGPWLRVHGAGGFGARAVSVPPLRSSQTLSALWLAAGDAPITWSLQAAIGSRGYLDLTAEMLRQARGADALQESADGRRWEQRAGYGAAADLSVPGDPSGAVFFAVAAILLERSVRLDRAWNPRHADAALLGRLRREEWLEWTSEADGGVRLWPGPSARTRPLVVDLDEAPDSGPALAVLASHLPNGGRFSGLTRLRIKESDRVAAMERLAAACGADAAEDRGGLAIRARGDGARLGQPASPRAAMVECCADHRTAMAAGIASLLHPGLEPDNRACVAKSFPQFWEQLARLRA